MIHVHGYCPMGCGATLKVDEFALERDGGPRIYCSAIDCPDFRAVEKLLLEPETEHLVDFRDDDTFTVQHPLRERLDEGLFACTVHTEIHALGGPPVDQPGIYRAIPIGVDLDSTSHLAPTLHFELVKP